jgi:hypothetical protein
MAHSKFQKDTTPQTEVIAERKKNGKKFFLGLSQLFVFLIV